MSTNQPPAWDQRYAIEDYLFGERPNRFLASQASRLKRGQSALALADGEARNGVWLAEQGLEVLSVDASAVALRGASHARAAFKSSSNWPIYPLGDSRKKASTWLPRFSFNSPAPRCGPRFLTASSAP